MLTLPTHLLTAIEAELSQIPTHELITAADELSQFYRSPRHNPFILKPLHCLAYLAVRLPATFMVATVVCARLPQQMTSLLDCGAGPGTLLWALSSLQHPLKQATLYERDRSFVALGQRLQKSMPDTQTIDVDWRTITLQTQDSFPSHDIVSISYVLNELDLSSQKQLISRAWSAATQAVVIIEPGTPQGFKSLLQARQQLIDQGACIFAPCPHNLTCPMAGGEDWCHFSARLPRSSWHRQIKQAQLAFEDEKYCYLIATKEKSHEAKYRIIKRPLRKSGHVTLDLCTPSGLKRSTLSKRDKIIYSKARNVVWGDTWI